MLTLIIGIAGMLTGGIITWVITRHYYVRATKDQTDLYNKLSEFTRKVILEDQREKLTVKELNEILVSKTIDKNHKGQFPYKACPKCGSENLKIDTDYEVDHDGDDFIGIPFDFIQCVDCGWGKTESGEDIK